MVLHSVRLLCKKRARGVLCNKPKTQVRDFSPIEPTALKTIDQYAKKYALAANKMLRQILEI